MKTKWETHDIITSQKKFGHPDAVTPPVDIALDRTLNQPLVHL